MKDRVNEAKSYFQIGFNCAQAVAYAYHDLIDIDDEKLVEMMEGFGIGMGSMEGTCGAVVGAVFSANMAYVKKHGSISREKAYAISRKITNDFLDKNGTLSCKVLKGIGHGKGLRSCMGCVEDATTIVKDVLYTLNIEKDENDKV